MGTVYSISRIGTFDDCRLRYKYQYVDRLKADKDTIEAFMGNRVHEALQELYGFVKNGVVKPLEWLLETFEGLWERNMTSSVKVVRLELGVEDYRKKGRKCLEDYYARYAPFDQAKIVATEKKVTFKLHDIFGEVDFLGYIDRLDWDDKRNRFEIHDYKTSGSLPSQSDADGDEQLGLYHLAVRSEWPDAENVELVWHYLVFNKEIVSSRKPDDLAALESEIVGRVRKIEACTDFPPCRSALCDWCGYQEICPEWKHVVAVKSLPRDDYMKDEGVALVARFADLEERRKVLEDGAAALEAERAALEEAAFAFAREKDVRVIDGPGHQLILSEKTELSAPMKKEDEARWEGLRTLLLAEKKYEDVSTINNYMLVSRMKGWPEKLMEKVRAFLIARVTRNVYLRKKG
jgi:putative RecB family exonuclease